MARDSLQGAREARRVRARLTRGAGDDGGQANRRSATMQVRYTQQDFYPAGRARTLSQIATPKKRCVTIQQCLS